MDPQSANNEKPGPDAGASPGRRPESWLNELDSLVPNMPAEPVVKAPASTPPFVTAPITWPELELSGARPEPINVMRPALLDQLPPDLAIINDTWNVQPLPGLDEPPAPPEPPPVTEPPAPEQKESPAVEPVEPAPEQTASPAIEPVEPEPAAVPVVASTSAAEPPALPVPPAPEPVESPPSPRVDERTLEFIQPRRAGSSSEPFLRVLLVASVFLAVAAGACAWFYFHMGERMTAVSKERSGVDYLARCRELLHATAKHRELAAAFAAETSQRQRIRSDMRAAAGQAESSLKALRVLESRWTALAPPAHKTLSADAYQDVVNQWARLQAEAAQRFPAESPDAVAAQYQSLVAAIQRLSALGSLESGLARDGDPAVVLLQECWLAEPDDGRTAGDRSSALKSVRPDWSASTAAENLTAELDRRSEEMQRTMIIGFSVIVGVLALALGGLVIVAPKSAG